MPVAIKGEHLPTEVNYDAELQSGQDPGEDDKHSDELHLDGLMVCSEILLVPTNSFISCLVVRALD